MKYSKDTRGKQKTSKEDWPAKNRVEPEGMPGVPSVSAASENGRNDDSEYSSNLLEMVVERNNLNTAYKRVKANRGSHGVDSMTVDELLPYLKEHGQAIRKAILEGSYTPEPDRRVEIPKPGGGTRLLGIPTVLDRMIQQAIYVIASDQHIPLDGFTTENLLWCHPKPLPEIAASLNKWIWWYLPDPPNRSVVLKDIINFNAPVDIAEKRDRLLNLTPERHQAKMLESVKNGKVVFPGYKRVRNGKQVLELRFDDIAGCLRTPERGSSKQYLVLYKDGVFETLPSPGTATTLIHRIKGFFIIPVINTKGWSGPRFKWSKCKQDIREA